eukprot:CAMPEP_0195522448 /NCGR_PEP_ID=MMETSP0794_2-20130614/20637_1 /TAXON_ID=515487 /ORGANISM="Stephanopyxis turris, Strain CCMP 815" /LENGTH=243 /DNA_ID=CAMNT_0040652211 /DNA_START=187 /DNA_END=918 /DNA_ORIENTATION=+
MSNNDAASSPSQYKPNPSQQSPRTGVNETDGAGVVDQRRGSSFLPGANGMGGIVAGGSGDELLVGFPGSDDDMDEDEDDYFPPTNNRASKAGTNGGVRGGLAKFNVSDMHIPAFRGGRGGGGGGGGGGGNLYHNQPQGQVGGGGGGNKRRGSAVLQPMALGALGAFDSDFEDSDEECDPSRVPPSSVPGMSGGPAPHRPLVGGFAAAAYEAARDHHYKTQSAMVMAAAKNAQQPTDQHPPPSN